MNPKHIVVSGTVCGVPGQGGAAWAVLQYVLGLRGLGHEVTLIEPVPDVGDPHVRADAEAITRDFGLEGRFGIVEPQLRRTHGMTAAAVRTALDEADVLLNLSGVLRDEELLARPALRVFVDLDPAFTQLWVAAEGIDLGLDLHERHVTIGMCVGTSGCQVPTAGREWIRTPQPIALEHWPVCDEPPRMQALTTVGHWRAYGSIHHDGVHYGQKAHAMRPLLGVATRASPARFALALAIHPDERADLAALQSNGWTLLDPAKVTATTTGYARFVRGSQGEFGLAKLGYVVSRCGWFSDRSVCYLASGRPVVTQDTGLASWMPVGAGVLPFSTAAEAVDAVAALRRDEVRHRRAARRIAEEIFDARRVLPALLERL